MRLRGELPAFTAGAHIDLTLPNGLIRSYSLTNRQPERHRYVIAVQKDRATRGGSKWVHENLRPGDVLTVNGPRNNFPLSEAAASSLLIAGGIGITPILCMVERLAALQRDWRLVYCARKRSDTAFVETLSAYGERVRFKLRRGPRRRDAGHRADLRAAPPGAHLYCCGPLPMLAAFEAASAGLARERVHVEYFSAKEPPAVQGGFKVVLARTGRELVVPPGKTILDTLLDAGLELAYSEQAAGSVMMICCSGSKSERLVLDL